MGVSTRSRTIRKVAAATSSTASIPSSSMKYGGTRGEGGRRSQESHRLRPSRPPPQRGSSDQAAGAYDSQFHKAEGWQSPRLVRAAVPDQHSHPGQQRIELLLLSPLSTRTAEVRDIL